MLQVLTLSRPELFPCVCCIKESVFIFLTGSPHSLRNKLSLQYSFMFASSRSLRCIYPVEAIIRQDQIYISFSTYRYLAQADSIATFKKSAFVNKVLLKHIRTHLLTYGQQQPAISKDRVEELQQRLHGHQSC